jgi:hypothetical protein
MASAGKEYNVNFYFDGVSEILMLDGTGAREGRVAEVTPSTSQALKWEHACRNSTSSMSNMLAKQYVVPLPSKSVHSMPTCRICYRPSYP